MTKQSRIDEKALQEKIAEGIYPPINMETSKRTKPITAGVNTVQGEQFNLSSIIDPRIETVHRYYPASFEEYSQVFLQAPRLADRKPVFVSASTRERLDRIVRQLGDRKMSVSGLIENLALHHLKTYGEDIEQWRKQ